jgi:hypothetical protein
MLNPSPSEHLWVTELALIPAMMVGGFMENHVCLNRTKVDHRVI